MSILKCTKMGMKNVQNNFLYKTNYFKRWSSSPFKHGGKMIYTLLKSFKIVFVYLKGNFLFWLSNNCGILDLWW